MVVTREERESGGDEDDAGNVHGRLTESKPRQCKITNTGSLRGVGREQREWLLIYMHNYVNITSRNRSRKVGLMKSRVELRARAL